MPIAKPVAAALVLLAASANAAPDAPCQVSQRALQGCIATSSVDAGFSCCDELRALRAQGCHSDRLELAYNSLCAEASAELLQEEIGEDDLISIHAVLSSAGRNDLADSIFEVEHWQDGKGIGTSANESEWSGDELTETYDDEGAEDDTKRTASVSGESERAGLSSHPFPSTFGLLASLHELSDSLLRAVSSRGGAQRAQSKIKGPSSGETRARKGFSLRASLVALKSGCWKAGSRPSGGPSAARAAGRRWGGRWTATASDDATERAHGSARQDSEFGSADALVDGLRSSRSGPCPRAQRRASGGEALRGSHRDSRPESDVSSFSLASMTSLNGGQLVVDDLGGLVGVWGAEEPERVSMAGRLDVSEADLSSALKSEHVRSRAVQRIGNHGDPGSGLSSREGSVDPSLALDETTPGEASSLASSMRRLSTFGNLRAPLSKKHTGRFSHAKPKLAPSGDRRQNAIVDRVARLQSTLKGVGNAGSLLPSSMPSLAKNIMGLGSEDEVESVVDTGIVKRLERNADDLAAALDREASVHGDAIATKVWRTKNGELLALAE